MPSRRAFLQSLGLLAVPLAAGALNAARLPGPAPSGSPHFQGPYGLQLYSLRNQIPADPGLWFKRIRTIGYTHVEAAGLYNMTPQVFRQHLDQASLKCDGMHEPYPALDKNFSQIVDTAHTLGVEYVICSWVDEPLRPDLDGWRRVADTFNRWGDRLKSQGLKLGYHNHDYEWELFHGEPAMQVLLDQTHPGLVDIEMDTFWVLRGGQDPVTWLKRYPSRFRLLHLKGMRRGTPIGDFWVGTSDEDTVPLGQGILNVRDILIQAVANGITHTYLEDESKEAPEGIVTSMNYLKTVRI